MHSPIVHVVDDDRSIRVALTRLLHTAGFDCRTYASAGEFLAAEREDAPGCLILDVMLPGLTGVELQAALVRNGDSLPIVFLTGRGDINTSVRAMKAGAVDFLTKPVQREPLLSAIRAALSRNAQERTRNEDLEALRGRFARLSAREREVFERVVQGRLNKQIADDLGTSIRTVKAHRAQVMSKMEVDSLAQLVAVAGELGATRRVH